MTRNGDILGYARVSTSEQNTSPQSERLIDAGPIRVFEDVISGKKFERPGLAS
jgi:DNA invertase Pin-like site-specific DNA recombinase